MTIRASDREVPERFYETVLATLGVETGQGFSVAAASGTRPATKRLHIGFAAPSRAHVDEFWRAGTAAGYRDDGAPGPRPQYVEDYYGSFLLDPDGNSAEAVHHGSVRTNGIVDHLWIRVANLAASRRFYEKIAPYARIRMTRDTPERVHFRSDGGVFSLLPGEPTETRHLVLANEEGAISPPWVDPSGFIIELIAPGRAPG